MDLDLLRRIKQLEGRLAELETHDLAAPDVFRTTPLTSTSWDGDAYSTTAKTKIDLSAVFSVPAGVRAVLAHTRIRDSGSAGGSYFLALSPNDTAGSGLTNRVEFVPNDTRLEQTMIVPCDSSGDIYYQIGASDTGTMDVWIEIWGYWT